LRNDAGIIGAAIVAAESSDRPVADAPAVEPSPAGESAPAAESAPVAQSAPIAEAVPVPEPPVAEASRAEGATAEAPATD
jgi:hypothetical protein